MRRPGSKKEGGDILDDNPISIFFERNLVAECISVSEQKDVNCHVKEKNASPIQ